MDAVTHLTERGREPGGRLDGDTGSLGGREPRIVLGRLEAKRGREASGGDHSFVARDDDGDGARLQPPDDLAEEFGGIDRNALLLDLRRNLDPVRDLEVRTDELETLFRGGDAQVLQDWERAELRLATVR